MQYDMEPAITHTGATLGFQGTNRPDDGGVALTLHVHR